MAATAVVVVVHRSGIPATTSTSTSSEGWSGVRYRVSAVGRWPVTTGGQNGCRTSFRRSKLTSDYFYFPSTGH